MNKQELIDAVATRVGVDKRTANNAVEAVVDTVQRAVAKGEKVSITGFGVFEKVDRAARMGRNPATGEQVRVKKTSVPKFRAGSQFKGVVSGAVKLARETTAAVRGGGSRATGGRKATVGRTAKAGTRKASTSLSSTGRSSTGRTGSRTTKRSTGGRSTAKRTTSGRSARGRR